MSNHDHPCRGCGDDLRLIGSAHEADCLARKLGEEQTLHLHTKSALSTERHRADDLGKRLIEAERRLETALLWIEAVRSCAGDTWECPTCGHSEPWWTGSNAEALSESFEVDTKRVNGALPGTAAAVERRCQFGFAPNAMLDYETQCTLPAGHDGDHKLARA